ncbi:unnamed protein product [Sphenostylis stenocarpa]|uniref:Uncharacterized protein n=1 Tax=Sphenostylis stenocarpa TaxID=92480 RepID=A0AA86S124_9FABA|nr:unnamed protein product [Sphenostylis stenocarpa]
MQAICELGEGPRNAQKEEEATGGGPHWNRNQTCIYVCVHLVTIGGPPREPCLELAPRAIVPRHGTHAPPYQPAFIAITWPCLQRTVLGESHPKRPIDHDTVDHIKSCACLSSYE